jgi:hypothetical protein
VLTCRNSFTQAGTGCLSSNYKVNKTFGLFSTPESLKCSGVPMIKSHERMGFYLSVALALPALGGIRGPGKYSGVVIFDRWGGCHLYSGAYVMEVSESVKDLLRPYANRPVLVDAKEVLQPMNPGDGLIEKLEVLGPSVETTSAKFGKPPLLEDLSLKVFANFSVANGPELIIELRNTGTVKRGVDMQALGPTLLAKKQEPECFGPSDGPSFVAVTRTNVDFMHQHPAGGGCHVNGKGGTIRMWLPPGVAVPRAFDLEPGQSMEVPLQFELSEGEYEFLAGYGGGVHETRTLVSNRIALNINGDGEPEFIGAAAKDVIVTRTRRLGPVCGSVTSEDGSPVVNARVFLWPTPLSNQELRAANNATANQAGEFRMENVTEGHYVVSAVRTSGMGVYTGASGSEHLAGAASLALPAFPEECSVRLILHRAATYTVRGKTAPPPNDRTYSARIILKRGDAYPFEITVPISSDGHYEFRGIPAGSYQFFAGNVGSGFEADRDIDGFDVNVNWGVLKKVGVGSANMPMEFHEAIAHATLSGFYQSLQMYEGQYHLGYPQTLKFLGQPPSWAIRNAEHAGLVDDKFPGNEFADDGSCISEGSYRITYQPGPVNDHGKITHYLLSARPLEFGKTGKRSFVIDDTGQVHRTEEDRPASISDPPGVQ